MFWIGLVIGAVIGMALGILLTVVYSLLVIARRSDDNMELSAAIMAAQERRGQ